MADPVLIHASNAAAAAERYGIPASVLLGILSVEGGTDGQGRPVAPADGAGPPSFGQFTYGTGKGLGIKYGDSASEVDGIARLLLQDGWKNDPDRAIGAYNGGIGNPQMGYAAKVRAAAARYVGFDTGASSAPSSGASSPSSAPASSGLSPAQHSTLATFGLSAVLVAAAVAAIAFGSIRVARSGAPA